MKADVDCLACIVKQCTNTLKVCTDDQARQQSALEALMEAMRGMDLSRSPAECSNLAYRIAEEWTGVSDPFYTQKRKHNRAALDMYPTLKQLLDGCEDRLHTAVKLAIAGNVIDLGIGQKFSLKEDVEAVLRDPLAIDHVGMFKDILDRSENILYVGDNAGEIVFDRLLVEELLAIGKKVVFVVRGGPAINDALMEDAEEIGLTALCPVITTGSNEIGLPLIGMSDECRRAMEHADILISKGQANFERLDELDKTIFFALKAKCDLVAKRLGVGYLDSVFVARTHLA